MWPRNCIFKWATPRKIVCGAFRMASADSSSSSLAIHKVWRRLSSSIRQNPSRKSSLPPSAGQPCACGRKGCKVFGVGVVSVHTDLFGCVAAASLLCIAGRALGSPSGGAGTARCLRGCTHSISAADDCFIFTLSGLAALGHLSHRERQGGASLSNETRSAGLSFEGFAAHCSALAVPLAPLARLFAEQYFSRRTRRRKK